MTWAGFSSENSQRIQNSCGVKAQISVTVENALSAVEGKKELIATQFDCTNVRGNRMSAVETYRCVFQEVSVVCVAF